MQFFTQMFILAAFLATMTSAQTRGANAQQKLDLRTQEHRALKMHSASVSASHSASHSKSHKKSKSHSKSYDGNDVEGEIGCRKECSDKRFTMVCEWEANKGRRLAGEELDFEDEENETRTLEVATPDGRRLGVELEHVTCILGVGKKDSDDSSEDYEEYKERLSFPNDAWNIKIKEASDGVNAALDDITAYKFSREVAFEDIEDPNDSGDEITIKGTLEVELVLVENSDAHKGKDVLIYDDSDLSFSC